jgi:RimJ/RimL family protein N-acetyltransferase
MSIFPQEIEGSDITMRLLAPSDFDALFAAASDPELWQMHSDRDRWKLENFKVFFAKALRSGSAYIIFDRGSGEVVGSSRFYDFNGESKQIFIGYTFLKRKYWGGPWNVQLKTLMLDHAFSFVDRVLFHTSAENLRSQRAIAKLGAERREELVRPLDLDGAMRVEYVLRREKWLLVKSSLKIQKLLSIPAPDF